MANSEHLTQSRAAAPGGVRALRAFWGLFTNIRLTIVLLILIALASFAGALFPQAPAGLEAYTAQYAQWLQEMRGRYGSLASILFGLGLFDLYSALWFKALLVLLTLNVVVCTANRLPTIIKSVFGHNARLSDAFYNSVPNRLSLPPRSGAVEALSSLLASLRYKVYVEKDGVTTYLYADKYGWAKLGTLATHLAIVMALVTVIAGGVMGFAEDGLIALEGQSVEIGHGTGLVVKNEDFLVDYYDDKTPKDYRSVLTVLENGREVKRQTVRVNEPLIYGGVRLHQMGYGAVATVEVKDEQGRLIQSTKMNMQPGRAAYYQGDFQVLGTDLVLAGLLPAGSESGERGMTLFAMKGDSVLANYKLKVGESQLIQGYRVTLAEARDYTVLRAAKDPGSPVIWIASPLFILGVCVTLYLPRRRIWARLDSGETLLTGAADRTVRFRQELDDIAAGLCNRTTS